MSKADNNNKRVIRSKATSSMLCLIWNLEQDISVTESPSLSSSSPAVCSSSDTHLVCFVCLTSLVKLSTSTRSPYLFTYLLLQLISSPGCSPLLFVVEAFLRSKLLHAYPYHVWSIVFDYLPACLAPLDLFVCSVWLSFTECAPPHYQAKPSFITVYCCICASWVSLLVDELSTPVVLTVGFHLYSLISLTGSRRQV